MYLHIGQDRLIKTDDIIGIFDLDSSTVSVRTRDFLRRRQLAGSIVAVGQELPKSFILCRDKKGNDTVYLSQISPGTLLKRVKSGANRM